MQSARSPWNSPKRLATSMLLVLLLGGTAGGIVGFASAQDPAAVFMVAAPMAGDHAVYRPDNAGGDGAPYGWYAPGQIEQIHVQWLPDAKMRTADGEAVWANRMRIAHDVRGEDEAPDLLYAVLPGSRLPFGHGTIIEDNATEDGRRLERVATQFVWQEGLRIPCGVRLPVQGQVVGVGRSFAMPEPCVLRGDPDKAQTGTLRVLGLVQDNGTRYLVAASYNDQAPDADTMYWFEEGIPYPVRIEDPHRGHALVMRGFQRGTEEVRQKVEDQAGAPAPPLAFAARQPWGPDDAGVEHAFPLSAAYQASVQHVRADGLRDYLRDHPEAYMQFAAYQYHEDMNGNGLPSHHWSMALSDARENYRWSITWEEPRLAAVLPAGLLPDAANTYSLSAGQREESTGHEPLPASLPADFPTVASALAQWEVYRGADYADASANHWRLDVSCHLDCSEVDVRLGAGHIRYERVHHDGAGPDDALHMSALEFWHVEGRDDISWPQPYLYYENRQDWRDADAPPAHRPTSAAAQAPRVHMDGTWAMPDGKTGAAISLGSVLVGLAYHFWPALRTAGLGLFSRVRKDALLEHPVRQRLHDLIMARPGIHQAQIEQTVGRGRGQVDHHLRKLVQAGLVVVHSSGGYRCHFIRGSADRRAMAHAGVLKAPAAQRIHAALQEQPSLGINDLARRLDLSPSTVHRHVTRMREAGVVA